MIGIRTTVKYRKCRHNLNFMLYYWHSLETSPLISQISLLRILLTRVENKIHRSVAILKFSPQSKPSKTDSLPLAGGNIKIKMCIAYSMVSLKLLTIFRFYNDAKQRKLMNIGGKFLKKLWSCVGGEFYTKISFTAWVDNVNTYESCVTLKSIVLSYLCQSYHETESWTHR